MAPEDWIIAIIFIRQVAVSPENYRLLSLSSMIGKFWNLSVIDRYLEVENIIKNRQYESQGKVSFSLLLCNYLWK